MATTLGAQEVCRNKHLRTPENTYISPKGKRHCRDCSGYKAAPVADLRGTGRGRAPLTRVQLEQLRYIARCLHCGAVPTETGETHEVGDGNGGTVILPKVVTPHLPGCGGVTKVGRPRKPRAVPIVSGGLPACEWCGTGMVFGVRPKRWCDANCRSSARKAAIRDAQRAVTS